MEILSGFETIEVETSCGRVVTCSYLEHPKFDRTQNIWQSLHYVFLQYVPTVSYSGAYLLRSSLNALLDYISERNALASSALQITHFIDLSTEVFNGYVSYLRKNEIPVTYADKLKTATTVASKNTGKLPLLLFPSVDVGGGAPTEPLTDEAYEELVHALKTHVGSMEEKLKFRGEVESAVPYDYESAMAEIYPAYNRTHVFQWYQYALLNVERIRADDLKQKLRATTDEELIALCERKDVTSAFIEIYEREASPHLPEIPTNPFGSAKSGMSYWFPDTARTLKTFLTHGFPFAYSFEELDSSYNRHVLYNVNQCDNIVKLLIHKYTTGARLAPEKTPLFDEMMAMYYPTSVDMIAIITFMMLQSGWNKESVLLLDREEYEHVLTGAIKESMRVVFSGKNKSQSLNTPYVVPKQVTANSDKDNPYSLYNLIILADKLSEPLQSIPFDVEPVMKKGVEMNRLFLCFKPWGEWQGRGGRHSSLTNPKAYQTAVKAFFDKYPVYENGRRLAVAGDIGRRLRPTWSKYQRKTNPLSLLSLQMGHEDQETTDLYYDSSGGAMQDRRIRLRSALEEIMHLLRTRQFQGMLGEQASALANVKPRFFHIPGQDRPIWGCRNQFRPSWPGAARQIAVGEKCTAIDKCLGCSQVWITEDSLPYIFERLKHLEEELDERDEATYSARLEAEKEIIEYLIDSWEDEDAIRLAERYQRKNSPLLPRDLASLRLIFQEENASGLQEESAQQYQEETAHEHI